MNKSDKRSVTRRRTSRGELFTAPASLSVIKDPMIAYKLFVALR